jgi:hypothetical protein
MSRTILSWRDVSTFQPQSATGPATTSAPAGAASSSGTAPAVPPTPSATPVPGIPDSYTDRLLKLIPSEVISLYVTLHAFILGSFKSDDPRLQACEAVIAGIGVLGTPYYLTVIGKVRKGRQIAFSTISFVIWVLAIGGPFRGQMIHVIGGILLVVFTFAIPKADF